MAEKFYKHFDFSEDGLGIRAGENAMHLELDNDLIIFKKNGEQEADFISCVAFGKAGEFAEKYFHKGTKIAVVGRIQTGSYTNKDGAKVYTTDVVVEEQEFAESKASSQGNTSPAPQVDENGFMNIPDGIDEDLPFN